MKHLQLAVAALLLISSASVQAAPFTLEVVDAAGQPVADAYVRLSASGEPGGLQLKTDAAGKAAGDSPGLEEETQFTRVIVFARGHAPAGWRLKAGQTRVRLKAAKSAEGRIVDAKGQPLAGVAVGVTNVFPDRQFSAAGTDLKTLGQEPQNAIPEFWLQPKERGFFLARTDAAGRYRIDNLPKEGKATIQVQDPLWQSAFGRIDLGNEQTVSDISTSPAARLSGRILDVDGKPLVSKSVFAQVDESYASGETDAEGRYLLGGLTPGEAVLWVTEQPELDKAVYSRRKVTAVAGEQTEVPDMRAEPGGFIEVKLAPAVSGGQFAFVRKNEPGPPRTRMIKASEGVLRVRMLPGFYRLDIALPPKGWSLAKGIAAEVFNLEVKAGQTTQTEVAIVPSIKLIGIVRDEKGQVVSGARIGILYGPEGPSSDAAGRFSLENLQAGEISLSSSGGWEIVKPQKLTLPLPGLAEVIVRKVPLAPLTGRVVDEAGEPIADATVRASWIVRQADGMGTSASVAGNTDKLGRYTLQDVRADAEVQVKAGKPQYRSLRGGETSIERTILGVNGAQIPNPEAAFAATDIVLQNLTKEATGRVIDSEGKPVANALVAALAGGMDEEGRAPRNIARTDAGGHFTLRDLPSQNITYVAGKGDGYGVVNAITNALPDIVLEPVKRQARDLAAAEKLLTEIVAATRGTDYYIRVILPYVIGRYDFAAGRKLAAEVKPDGTVSTEVLRYLFTGYLDANPEQAQLLLPDLLPALEDEAGTAAVSGAFADVLVRIAALVPQPEKRIVEGEVKTRAEIRAWIWRHYDRLQTEVQRFDFETARDYESSSKLAALSILGHLLGDGIAGEWLEDSMAIANRYDALQPEGQGNAASWNLAQFVYGGGDWVERALPLVPPAQRAYALGLVIPRLAKTDTSSATRLLEVVLAQEKPTGRRALNGNPDYAFGLGAKAILARLRKAEAGEALALARRVTEPMHKAEALALAARLQSEAQAADLFNEAMDLALANFGGRGEGRVISLALESNPAVGEQLLERVENRQLSNRRPGDYFSDSDTFRQAFYFATTQPGRARAWLEAEWARAQNKLDGVNGPHILMGIAMAMAAVNRERALEMAASIPPQHKPDGTASRLWQWETQRKIAQFLAAPEEVRRTLHFERWSASDSWAPGEDTGW